MPMDVDPFLRLACLTCDGIPLLTDVAVQRLIAPGKPPSSIELTVLLDAEIADEVGLNLWERYYPEQRGYWRLTFAPDILSLHMRGGLTHLTITYCSRNRARITLRLDEAT